MSLFSKTIQTVEIDYDKLAQSIVKAQNKAEKDTIKDAVIEAQKEINKKEDSFKYSKEFLKVIIFPTLCILTVVGLIGFICSVAYIVEVCKMFSFTELDSYMKLIVTIAIGILSLLFAIFSGLTAKEVNKGNDMGSLSSIFSNMVSFVALIVAIIALMKGVA